MDNSFNELKINSELINGLKKAGISSPTDIQAKTIPLILENKDVIGESETGSGKTLAYLLPLFQKIDASKKEFQSIILAPTHELAVQINSEIKKLAENSLIPITSTTIIGEVNIKRQVEKLKEKPHIVVGSTGRILELIKMRKINTQTVKTIVIDEGDKLLDHNNLSAVKDLIKTTMRDRQLLVFSASITEDSINTAKELMKEAELVKIEAKTTINPNVEHMYFICDQRDKIEILRKLLASIKSKKIMVFINKNDEINKFTSKLRYHHINAYGIHGSSSKEERKKALEGFRSGRVNVLVASDLAARGLDIKGITHIINLDLPEDSKEYLHRVGRTGRMGNSGITISVVAPREEVIIKSFEKEFGIEIPLKEMFKGNIVDVKSHNKPINSNGNVKNKNSSYSRPSKKNPHTHK